MSLPKICGLETEYGLVVGDPRRLEQQDAALELLESCPLEPLLPWDMADESPGRDARAASDAAIGSAILDSASHAGFMLGNGARLYVDHGHPEYSTPECADALALVVADKAGERLLEQCGQALNAALPSGQSVQLFKNNSDHQDHSYGCHENYLLDASCYRRLFDNRSLFLHAHLVPFLISRQVVCGSGKVGSENGRPPVDFQISQRADFFECLIGLETMSHRPIVNTRDESHADRSRYRRLHVILGDANMSEVSAFLKIGTMQLFLAMIEDGEQLPNLALADPLAAMVQISHDPSCRERVALADGRQMTAVEMQLAFAEAAQRYVQSEREAQRYEQVLARWTETLEQLRQNPLLLVRSLDWVIKWNFIGTWRRDKALDWSAYELKELDIRYHGIERDRSIFYLLEGDGRIERLLDDEQIARAMAAPPDATRAAARAAYIRQAGAHIRAASWGAVVERDASGQSRRVVLNDPIRSDRVG